MGDVVAIPDLKILPREPDERIVEALRELLEMAERGEVRGLAFVADLPDAVHVYHHGVSRFTLLGSLTYLSNRVSSFIERDGG